MTTPDLLTVRGFGDVDADRSATQLVDALDEISSLPAVQRLRAAATELLAPRLGAQLLDIGCGTGDIVRALAGIVGPTGRVVGVEPSAVMLTEARRRTGDRSPAIEFQPGDAARLEFDDGSFDGARCERVFQHLEDPEAAMAELVRVTKPGGRVVVVDTDWGMHAVYGADSDLTARVIACWADHVTNGYSGRRLPSLFAGAGIREPTVVAETFTSADPQRPWVPPFTVMAAAAAQTGALRPREAEEWLAQLRESGRRGHFFWAVTMFAVGGSRT